MSQCSGLVKSDPGYLGQTFQGISFPYQKTMFGGVSDCCHNSSRGCKHKCTRTEHNKDRNCTDDLSGKDPGKCCSSQCNDHNPGSPTICHSYDLGFSRICRLYQTDHTLDGTVLSNLSSFHLKSSELIHGSGCDLIPCSLIYRKRFSCHNCLVYRSLPGKDHSVYRNRLSRKNS